MQYRSGLYTRAGSWRSSSPSLSGFTGYFYCSMSLKYVDEMDPQPSTFHNTPATKILKENAVHRFQKILSSHDDYLTDVGVSR